MVGAISPRGQLHFMVVKGSFVSDHICDFLRRLMDNAEGPVILVWDGHPIHKSKKVRNASIHITVSLKFTDFLPILLR